MYMYRLEYESIYKDCTYKSVKYFSKKSTAIRTAHSEFLKHPQNMILNEYRSDDFGRFWNHNNYIMTMKVKEKEREKWIFTGKY